MELPVFHRISEENGRTDRRRGRYSAQDGDSEYGDKENLSSFYKAIDTHYPVLCGADFWMHLTGDKNFYHRLAKAFGEVVDEDGIDGSALILAKVEEIAEEIREKGGL